MWYQVRHPPPVYHFVCSRIIYSAKVSLRCWTHNTVRRNCTKGKVLKHFIWEVIMKCKNKGRYVQNYWHGAINNFNCVVFIIDNFIPIFFGNYWEVWGIPSLVDYCPFLLLKWPQLLVIWWFQCFHPFLQLHNFSIGFRA